MKLSEYSFALMLVFLVGCGQKLVEERTAKSSPISARLDDLALKMVNYLPQLKVDSIAIPRALNEDGTLLTSNAKSWTSGFFPGILWQLYGHSNNLLLKAAAENWSAYIEPQKWDTHTHDLGFKINSSFGKAYKLEQNKKYRAVVVQASKTLIKRFDPQIGSIRSWDWNADKWQFPVIIDNMMNLEMLFDATDFTGDSIYYHVAYEHAKTTLKNHIRPDFSCYHVIDYDTITNQVRLRTNHQGLSDGSVWARGQAWSLYGFTTAFERTGDSLFLKQAIGVANFFFNHPNLPEDRIPYWDFEAPNIPNEPRDVSAAAIVASGLLSLQKYDPTNKNKYIDWASQILESLSKEEYQSQVPPFLLSQSTGSVPGNFEINVPIIYADYYYVEALLKKLNIQ